MTTANARELLDLKQRLENCRAEQLRQEGELKALQAQLKEKLGTDDPAQARKKIARLQDYAADLERQLREGLAVLKGTMTR